MRLSSLPLLFLVAALGACQSYRWGGTGNSVDVHVAPVTNESYAPQATTLLERNLRTALLRDGKARLVTRPRAADTQLSVTIESFEERFVSERDDDTGRPASLALEMTVRAEWTREGTEESIRFSESVPVYADPSIRDGVYMTMPQLTEKISRRIRDAVLHPWDIESAN